jgi:hypothetical protein
MALLTGNYGRSMRRFDPTSTLAGAQMLQEGIKDIGENVSKAIEKHKLDKIEQEMKPQFIQQAIKQGMDAETAEVAWKATSKSGRARGAEFMQSVNSAMQREQQAESIKLRQESLRQQNEFFKATQEARKKGIDLANKGKEFANEISSLNIEDEKLRQKLNEISQRIWPQEERVLGEKEMSSAQLEQLKQQTESLKQSIEQSGKLFEPRLKTAEAGATQAELEAKRATELTPLTIDYERGKMEEGKAELEIAQKLREMQGGTTGQATLRAKDQEQERKRRELEANQIRLMNAGALDRLDAATLKRNIDNDVYMVKFDGNGVPKATGDLAGATPEYRQRVMYEAEKLNDERKLRKLTTQGKQASINYTQAMTRYQEKLLNSAKDKTTTEFERDMGLALEMGWIDKDTAKDYYLQRLDTQAGTPRDATPEQKLEYVAKQPFAAGLSLRQLSDTYTLAKLGTSDQATYDEKKGILHYKYMGKDRRGNDKVIDGKIKITPDMVGKIDAFKAREKEFLEGGGTPRTSALGPADISLQGIQNALPRE